MSAPVYFPGFNSEIKLPLRFYTNQVLQNRFKKSCQDLQDYFLYSPSLRHLVFEFYRTPSNDPLTAWQIRDLDDNVIIDLTPDLSLIEYKKFTLYDYFIYKGDVLGQALPKGEYYSYLTDGTNEWFSETFQTICYTTGSENVSDSEFTNDDGSWVLFPGTSGTCTSPGGTINFTNSVGAGFYQNGIFDTYVSPFEIVVTLIAGTTGTIEFDCGGGDLLVYPASANGQQLPRIVYATSSDRLTVTGQGGYDGKVDRISVKPAGVNENSCHMRLVYKMSCGNLGQIYYESGLQVTHYLDPESEIIGINPTIQVEVEESGDREQVEVFKRRETEYRLPLGLMPAYLVDALAEMCLHDTITLYRENDLGGSKIIKPRLEVSHDSQGGDCLATVNLYFQIDESTITDGCCGLFEVAPDPCIGNEPELEFSGLTAVCEGTSISITVDNVAPGQSTGNTYSWTFLGSEISTSDTLNIPTGTQGDQGRYYVTVTNSEGCQTTTFVDIQVFPNPSLTLIDKTDESSPGANDGTIVVDASSGTGPYLYTEGLTINFDGNFGGLAAGTYTVQVTDSNSCTATIFVTIS